MRFPAQQLRLWILALAALALLLEAGTASAQTSVTNFTAYDSSVLSQADWRALEQSFFPQSFRGSMALIFPNRAPITDPAQVKAWIRSKPLLGFTFPGQNADPVGTWSLAKQFAKVNNTPGGVQRPVVAVNTGWTDFGMMFGHFYELGMVRPSVEAGKPGSEPVSKGVASLIRERIKHQKAKGGKVEPLLIGSHSAGGFYGANVAWNLATEGRGYLSPLRVYNVGLSVNLPKGVKAVQVLGSTDVVALVNSSTKGLTDPSTRIVKEMSHNGGKEWSFGDSFSKRPWKIKPMDQVFGTKRLLHRSATGTDTKTRPRFSSRALVPALRAAASRTKDQAKVVSKVAESNSSIAGVKRVLYLKLKHDAKMLKLKAKRQTALADLLQARDLGDGRKVRLARQQLRMNRQQRRNVTRDLQRTVKQVRRDMFGDSTLFLTQMGGETLASFTPWRMMEKATQASAGMMKLGTQWMGLWLNNPLMNPASAFFGSGRSSSSLRDSRDRGRSRMRQR